MMRKKIRNWVTYITKQIFSYQIKKIEEALRLYEEVILEKNKFYSQLSLNSIIENDLKNDEEILQLFDQVINIKA